MALKAVAAPLGSPVGGTGTTNTIPRWTGASTLGDSVIVQNAGGTAIAIGDAAGVSYVGLVQVKRAGGAGWLTLDHTGGSYAEVQSYNVPLYLNRQGNNTILNATSGNAGIGTASPGRKLEISAAAPLRMGTGGEYFDFLQYTPGTWAWLSSAGQYVASWKTSGGMGFGGIVAPASNTVDVSTAGWGLKLPATPGNPDTQTLDAYKENTTWAPTVTWGTGGTVTTTSATGAYTQIGNVVTFTVTIAYNCSVIPTGGSITMDLPRTSATGFNQRPGLWAFNAWNGVAGSNFLSIGSASTTATLRVANATGTADIATYLTVTASGALVITATYLAS